MTDSLQERFRMENLTEAPENPSLPFYLKAECRYCTVAFTVDLRTENLEARLKEHAKECAGTPRSKARRMAE